MNALMRRPTGGGGGGGWQPSAGAGLLDPPGGLPRGANLLELCVWTRQLGADAYDTDVPRAEFHALLQRAARHQGYTARQRTHVAYVVRDLALVEEDGAGRHQRLERRRLLDASEVPGAKVLAQTFERSAPPFAAFPCGARPHDMRRVTRLELRAHARARLVFEASRDRDRGALTRRVFLEVDLDPRGLAADMADLRRTVENTVQHVFMGLRPWRKRGG